MVVCILAAVYVIYTADGLTFYYEILMFILDIDIDIELYLVIS